MIRLLVIDDHAVVREGVKRILAANPEIVVAAEAEHAPEAYQALATAAFDMVLLDISLPQHNGFEVLQHLQTTHPQLPVLVFSVHPERQYVVRALKAGAAGYLVKSSAPRELANAIHKIAHGDLYVSDTLVHHLVHEVAETEAPLHHLLTSREHQVLRLLVAGCPLKRIAYDLELSVKTVSTYRRRLLEKLHLQSNVDLLRYALQHGLTE